MSFKEWITSSYPNPGIDGRWGWLHITVLILCVAIIFALALIFRNKSEKTRRIVILVLAGLILLFELTRRIVNLCVASEYTLNSVLYILLPRPWCAISCWCVIISAIFNKRFLYNVTSYTSLLCALVFFAYPSVGFNNKFILFENLYSIATHSLILISSITFITLRFTKFEFKTIWKEAICLAVIFLYAVLEIYVLKIESDPLYFMPGNDIVELFGLSYGAYLAIYIVFLIVYISIFYLIDDRKNVFRKRNKIVGEQKS